METVVDCVCGAKMSFVRARDAYKRCNTVYCDVCNEQMFNEMVYHCPRGYDDLHHANGYDLCPKCAMKKEEKNNDENVEEVLAPNAEPKAEEFEFSAQLAQIREIMALESAESDDLIKGLLVEHKGDISKVVPLLFQ